MNQEEHQHNSYPSPDIEIDLKPYFKAIFKYWWVIALSTIIGLLIFILYPSLKSKRYRAEANISRLKTQTQVVLDENFTTVQDDTALSPKTELNRPNALLALANSQGLKANVIGLAREQFNIDQDKAFPIVLYAQLDGDLIRLLVVAEKQEYVAPVANIWAKEFTKSANKAYLIASSDPSEARSAANSAFDEYQKARKALELFVASDRIDKLQMDQAYTTALLEQLKTQRQPAFVIANTAPISLTNKLLDTTQSVIYQQIDGVVAKQLDALSRDYNFWYNRKESLQITRLELEMVKSQLEQGMRPQIDLFVDALSTLVNKSGLTQLGENNQYELNINELMQYADAYATPQPITPKNTTTDLLRIFPSLTISDVVPALEATNKEYDIAVKKVDTLSKELLSSADIKTIPLDESQKSELFTLINEQVRQTLDRPLMVDVRSQDLVDAPLSKNIDDLIAYKQQLAAEILDAQAQKQILERTSTTTWELYSILDNKAREVEAQFATGSPQARIALNAYTPYEPDKQNILFVPAGAIGGFIVGLVLVLGLSIRQQIFKDDQKSQVNATVASAAAN